MAAPKGPTTSLRGLKCMNSNRSKQNKIFLNSFVSSVFLNKIFLNYFVSSVFVAPSSSNNWDPLESSGSEKIISKRPPSFDLELRIIIWLYIILVYCTVQEIK